MRVRFALMIAVVAWLLPVGPAYAAGPVTVPDFATINEEAVAVVYPLLNDSDPGGGSMHLVAVSATSAGDTRVDGPAVVFTPHPNWNGTVELTYTAGSAGGESPGTITITVVPVNDAPTANADTGSAIAGQAAVINVLANDDDIDGDGLTIDSVGQPDNGTATSGSGQVTYTADEGFAGTETFTYTIRDPAGATAAATVTITVTLPAPTTTTPPPTTAPPTTLPPPTTTAPTTTATPTTTAPPPATTAAPATTVAAGPILVPTPAWQVPADGPAESSPEGFGTALVRNLGNLAMLFFALLGLGLVAWILSQRGRAPRRQYAVVLVGRHDKLPVYDRPSAEAAIIHELEYSQRQVEVVGKKRTAAGRTWLPVSTPDGQGWAEAGHLTEDVARATFERDVADFGIVQELRRRLKDGATINCSPRGPIDPETFERDSGRRQLGGRATSHLAGLTGDWRASFHIDKTASLTALRPAEMRNFHWVSFEAPGLEPWQLFFEYHDGLPYPAAAMPENVALTV